MRGWRRSIFLRGLIVALCVQLLALPALSGTARAEDLMLLEETHSYSKAWAWTWLGLSLVSIGVAANDYNEIQFNMKKAKAAYDRYHAAKNASDAIFWRQQATTYNDHAQSYESTTNAALGLAALFAIAAIFTFRSAATENGAESAPMLLSERGVDCDCASRRKNRRACEPRRRAAILAGERGPRTQAGHPSGTDGASARTRRANSHANR